MPYSLLTNFAKARLPVRGDIDVLAFDLHGVTAGVPPPRERASLKKAI